MKGEEYYGLKNKKASCRKQIALLLVQSISFSCPCRYFVSFQAY